jgi:nicotinate dehydrogenase subunit B
MSPRHQTASARQASRREFLRTSGLLVASVAAISVEGVEAFLQRPAAPATGPYPDVDHLQLDSWIVIRPDNTATFFVGKTDLGQGTGTAFRQIMSDELDIAFDKTTCVMGATDVTVDQGGSGGSDALQTDGYPMRRVAAEARRALLALAAAHFGVPATALAVSDGVVTTTSGGERRVTYGELIGGRKFNVTLTGRNVDATAGQAPLKAVQAMKNVGRSPRRDDVPAKVDGTQRWAVDMKVPGMLHARHVRPPLVGATLKSVDEASVRSVPGLVKIVRKGNYLAVVCEREEQAIQAARLLKAEWTPPATKPFPASDDLFTYMRAASPSSQGEPIVVGDAAAALASACAGPKDVWPWKGTS